MTADGPWLTAEGIGMAFGGVPVLKDVSLAFRPGEILGLVGENGAGKSTFLKILSGLIRPVQGTLKLKGHPVRFHSPLEAQRVGIGLIPQEFNLADGLNVYENIFLGDELRTRFGLLDRPAMRRRAVDLLSSLGATQLPPDAPLSGLSAADRQLVEIAKALSHDAKLLLLDEPTSVLAGREIDALFERMRALSARGVAQIYISHKLREVKTICSRLAVLRDGCLVAESPTEAWSVEEIARRMVGRELSEIFPPKKPSEQPERLRLEHVSVPGLLYDISFHIRAGEIFGLAGLAGSGRTELAETLMGLRRGTGRIFWEGKEIAFRSPIKAMETGLAYLSEDRQGSGILTSFPPPANATLSSWRRYGRFWRNEEKEKAATADYIDRFQIKVPSLETPLYSLSGGNQQKVSLAKSVDTQPRILIADEPTRGVDLGARRELYRHLRVMADEGMSILLISSELEEVIGLATRIGVMRQGHLSSLLEGDSLNEEEIMLYATGTREASMNPNA